MIRLLKNKTEIWIKFLTVSIVMLLNTPVSVFAQWVFFPCDTTNSNEKWSGYFYGGGSQPGEHYLNITSETADRVEGSASMKIEYKIQASEGWGGYEVRVFANDPMKENSRFDLSSGKYLSYWYKTVIPVTATKPSNDIHFELKLKEKSDPYKGEDRWVYEKKVMLGDASHEWHQVIIPLDQKEWSMQAGDDNKTFDAWAVFGFEVAFIYIIDGTTETASGSILLDKFQLLGSNYNPLISFDEQGIADTTSDRNRKNAFWLMEGISSDNANENNYLHLSKENTDTVQGIQSLKLDYSLTAKPDTESVVEIEHEFPENINLGDRTALAFYLKNTVSNSLPERTFIRVEISDSGFCEDERWTAVADVDLQQTGEWQFVYLPIYDASDLSIRLQPKKEDGITKKKWFELEKGDRGFVMRDGENDGYLNLDRIKKIRIGIVVRGDVNGLPGEKSEGTFLIDFLTPSGFRYFSEFSGLDPTFINLISTEKFSNTITWSDAPGENYETYDVYANLKSSSVFKKIALHIPEGTESFKHNLIAPLSGINLKYKYGVTYSDLAGNSSYLFPSDWVTNTAKEIPVISNFKPFGFKPDGFLSEWNSIQPWEIRNSDSTGFYPSWAVHSGDQDLWYKSWVSISVDSLFAAFEIHDDFISTDTSKIEIDSDSPELMIGFYSYNGKDHQSNSVCSKITPDHHFRFNSDHVTDIRNFQHVISETGDSNYSWTKISDSVYVVEWGISLAELLEKDQVKGYKPFIPLKGMMLAFNLSVNDADETGSRESFLSWSPSENSPGLNSISEWGYTWLGNKNMTIKEFESFENYTDINEPENRSFEFSLDQNYPNPFNPETKISFNLKSATHVSIKVYNVLGAEITTLMDDFQTPGKHTLSFNAVNLASGIYFFRMNAGGVSTSRKMMLVK